LQTEGLLAAAVGQADRARSAIADAVRCEPRDEGPDAVGQAYLAAADVEQILGNTPAEREHLTAAQELFAAKGNVVEVRKVANRLRNLTDDG
ncbi:MAG TPA: hypothetical protein VF256_13240, partial [Streptosporangiaceae bacterium]